MWVLSPRGSWFHCSSEENVSKEVTGTVKTVLKDRESKLSLGTLDVGHTARCLLLLRLAVGRFTAQRYLVDLKQFRESLNIIPTSPSWHFPCGRYSRMYIGFEDNSMDSVGRKVPGSLNAVSGDTAINVGDMSRCVLVLRTALWRVLAKRSQG